MATLIERLRRLTPIQWIIVLLLVWFAASAIGSLLRDPGTLIVRLIILLIAFPVHEFAHAWTAVYFGDETPRIMGRLTLDPRSHLDLFGSVLLLFSGIGWAKPVPVNPMYLQRSNAMLWIAFAGPLSNLILAFIGATAFWFTPLEPSFSAFSGSWVPSLGFMVTQFIYINLILFFFNLIPLYPLDGEKVAVEIAPYSWRYQWERIRPFSIYILAGILFLAPGVLSFLVGMPAQFVFNLLV